MPLLRPGEIKIEFHAIDKSEFAHPLSDDIKIEDIIPTINLLRRNYDDVWAKYLLNERENMGVAIFRSVSKNLRIFFSSECKSFDGPFCMRWLVDRFSQDDSFNVSLSV